MFLASEGKLLLCTRCSKAWGLFGRLGYTTTANTAKPKKGNHYDTLGVKKDADAKEIKDAFIELSKSVHPDGNPSDPQRHDQFVLLNEAYMVLSNPVKRREYDAVRTHTSGATYQDFHSNMYTHAGYYEERLRRKEKMYKEQQKEGVFSSGHITTLALMGAMFFIGSAMLSGKARHDVKLRSMKIHQEFSQSQHKNREIRRIVKLRDVFQQRRKERESQHVVSDVSKPS